MKILSLETSSRIFSLAISSGLSILFYQESKLERTLSDSMIPLIDASLKDARLSLKDFHGFAIGLGPGSFTSLRIGLSTIKGFCFALDKPAIGVSSLDVIAQEVKNFYSGQVCVLTDAKRQMVYSALYTVSSEGIKRQGAYQLSALSDCLKKIKGECFFVGDGSLLYQQQIEGYFRKKNKNISFSCDKFLSPKASFLSEIALQRFLKKETDDIRTLMPLYLYPQDCQVRR